MQPTPPLFAPTHPDSKILRPTPAAEDLSPPASPPATCDPRRPTAAVVPFSLGLTPSLPPATDWGGTPQTGGSLTPAGMPAKPVQTASEGLPPVTSLPEAPGFDKRPAAEGADPRESSDLPLDNQHAPSCECALCRNSSSLDPLESSVKINLESFLPTETPLDELSLGGRFRHSGWASYRKKVWESLVRTGQTKTRLVAFATCGKDAWLMRSNEAEKCVDGNWRNRYKIQCTCCHDRLCTPCANSRSRVIQQHLLAQIGEKPVSFITLTLAGHDAGLREKVDRLYKHFRALRVHPTWADKVRGGAAFLEVKYSDKAARWHPHLHIICDADFIDQQDLCDAWRSITKDSFIVDIRRVRDAKVTGGYVTKYASKPLNTSFANDADLLDEAVMALKGRRLCLCFGSWYGTPLTYAEDETLADDLIDAAGYQRWCPLDSLLASALNGDPSDIAILRQLDVFERFVALANPPPGV
jgi:hypothetical protein